MIKVKSIASRQGSALIITLLMITVIASVSFSVTALSLSEFRKAGNLQDSIAAYYAAESGIEHGLMEYRLWHDAEISREVYDFVRRKDAQYKIPTASEGTAQTFRLTGADNTVKPGFVTSTGDKGQSWYDLKMFYRGDKIGELNSRGDPVVDSEKSPRVFRDSAAEYAIEGAKTLKIAWRPDPATLANPPEPLPPSITQYFLELIFTLSDSESCSEAENKILRVEKGRRSTINIVNEVPLDCDYRSVRIKPWNMPYAQYSLTIEDRDGKPMKIDQQKTTLQSTGYSGQAKRTLELNLSRTIGTVFEASDFLFLSAYKPLEF